MTKDTCSTDGCDAASVSRMLCKPHYDQARRAGHLPRVYGSTRGACSADGCDRPNKARGFCGVHYAAELERTARPCSLSDCGRPVLSRGWCRAHYSRWKTYGDPLATPVWSALTRETPDGMRMCRTCREFQPLDLFRIRTDKPGEIRSSKCRPCVSKNWHDNRDQNLATKAARNYGITAEQYTDLVNGSCHSCGGQNTQSKRRLHIDHCHVTGVIRGALCHSCNTALGLLKEDPIRIWQLATYLELHTEGDRHARSRRTGQVS